MSSSPQQGDGTLVQKVFPKRDGRGKIQLIDAETHYEGDIKINAPHQLVDFLTDDGQFFTVPLRNVEFIEWDNQKSE